MAAYASTVKDFAGSVNHGGRIKFSALRDNGKYTRAGLFAVRNLPVKCDEGRTKAFFSINNAVNVRQGKFSYRFNFGADGSARMSGRFGSQGNKAHGTVNVPRLDPDGPSGDHTNCTTNGARGWRASKQ